MNLFAKFSITIIMVFITFASFAQKGTVRGQISDVNNGEALFGATVLVEGTSTGTVADLDGKYSLSLEPGNYTLLVSFVSFETKKIEGLEIKAGQTVVKDIELGESAVSMDEVVVEAKALENTDNALLKQQKNSSVVQDGISNEQMKRTGDSEAASALKRVTGVSVEGGKYVYVRGLGDRYTKTTLNNAEIPGLDPNRNTVQMDLFPSSLLDNMMISKTYSPNLPGSFTGGLVNIKTKDFPDRQTLQVGYSVGFNTQASLKNNFLQGEPSGSDWLGFDNGLRDVPSIVNRADMPERLVPSDVEKMNNYVNAFNNNMDLRESTAGLNQSSSFSYGNQYTLSDNVIMGVIGGLSYQRNYQQFKNGTTNRFSLGGAGDQVTELNNEYLLRTDQSTQDVLWGSLLNTSFKLYKKHKISLNLMHNQSGTHRANYVEGRYADDGISPNDIYQSRFIQYLERGITNVQLQGEHQIDNFLASYDENKPARPIQIAWQSAYSFSAQNEPDLRYFSNDIQHLDDTMVYRIRPSVYKRPSRFFRDMNQENLDTKLDITIPTSLGHGDNNNIKVGGAVLTKQRDFNEKRFMFDNESGSAFSGDVNQYFSEENQYTLSDNFEQQGVVIYDFYDGRPGSFGDDQKHSYTGTQNIWATYAMFEGYLTNKIKTMFGARLEATDMEVKSDAHQISPGEIPKGVINELDILPAVTLIYEINKKTNLRASYGRTLARPIFRELAPFASFGFAEDYVFVGNENLQRTLIDNYDLRYEFYPRLGELISVSAYYKQFYNPIEVSANLTAGGTTPELTWRNVNEASAFGFELEVRKNLEPVAGFLKNVGVGGNASLIWSQVRIADQEYELLQQIDPNAPRTRQMFAQSPYLVNAYINYQNFDNGWEANLSYNIFGERISVIGVKGMPNVYEKPRPQLDFSVSKKFAKRWRGTFRARNLLNPDYRMAHDFRGKEFIFENYTLGRTYSLGISYTID